MKRKVEKVDVHKLVPVPVDLNKLRDVVKNDIVKKGVYNAKIKDIEDKIPDLTTLASNTNLNAKVNEVKNKIPSIINLATNAFLNAKTNEIKGEILALLTQLQLLLLLLLKIKYLILVI